MLQAALLPLGCALSRYLWTISGIVPSVVIGVTSFGLISYLFIVVAGAISADCPYQTPVVPHHKDYSHVGVCWRTLGLPQFQWDDYRLFGQKRISLAQHMVKVAYVGYQRMQRRKVPR